MVGVGWWRYQSERRVSSVVHGHDFQGQHCNKAYLRKGMRLLLHVHAGCSNGSTAENEWHTCNSGGALMAMSLQGGALFLEQARFDGTRCSFERNTAAFVRSHP